MRLQHGVLVDYVNISAPHCSARTTGVHDSGYREVGWWGFSFATAVDEMDAGEETRNKGVDADDTGVDKSASADPVSWVNMCPGNHGQLPPCH